MGETPYDDERLAMSDGHRLEFAGITKTFGDVAAVTDFSARVEPGVVTGFLGPNGAGKTTSLRILLGLVQASSGHATIGRTAYRDLANPLASVGSVLEAASFHPGRTAAAHLKIYAQAASLPVSRVDAVLGTVGLADVGGRKVGGFSLGMRQRLGLAVALLGDPGVLVLDEPSNGLDPEGIIWMRSFLRDLATEGRTILVSSHLLTEVQQTADALIIIANGKLVFQGSTSELSDGAERGVTVDSPDRTALAAALSDAGFTYTTLRTGLGVGAVDPARIGEIALNAGVALSSLQRRGASLEEVFLELVNGVRVHPSAGGDARLSALPVSTGAVPLPIPRADAVATPADVADLPADDVVTDPTPSTAIAVIPRTVVEENEPLSEPPSDEPRRGPFTVASTGVIKVVGDDDDDDDDLADDAADNSTEAVPAPRAAVHDGLASGPTATIGPDGSVAVSHDNSPRAEQPGTAAEGDPR